MLKLFTDIKKYKFLLRELVIKGIKLKYRRSYLGMIWSLLEPLLMTIVLTVIFGTLFNNNDPTYPLYILCGRLLYTYFSQATNVSLRSIRANASMIKKVEVPKVLYVLSVLIYNFIIFLISLIVLFGVAIVVKVYPTLNILMIWLPLVLLFFLALGIGLLLATIGVFFKDMEYLWSIIMTIIMYASAVFYYPERMLGSDIGWILQFNPLYQIIDMFRCCIFGEPLSTFGVCYAIVFTLLSVVIGCGIFNKKQDEFILHI